MTDGNYDYSSYAVSWDDPYPYPNAEQLTKLQKISDELASNFELPTIVHFELVKHLDWLSFQRSDVKVDGGTVFVPEDRPNFKATRKKLLTPLSNALNKAQERLHAVLENETFAEVLRQADTDDRLVNSISALIYIKECSERAENMAVVSGGQENPDWVSKFVTCCQKFWFEHQNEKTNVSFDRHYDDTPITEWVHALFVNIEAINGRNKPRTSLLNTAVKRTNAYRP